MFYRCSFMQQVLLCSKTLIIYIHAWFKKGVVLAYPGPSELWLHLQQRISIARWYKTPFTLLWWWTWSKGRLRLKQFMHEGCLFFCMWIVKGVCYGDSGGPSIVQKHGDRRSTFFCQDLFCFILLWLLLNQIRLYFSWTLAGVWHSKLYSIST